MAEAMPFPPGIRRSRARARRGVFGLLLALAAGAGSAAEQRNPSRDQAPPRASAGGPDAAVAREKAVTRESAAAREQARLCERENLEAGAAACREALALGIGEARRGAVRQMLARHLVALERWDQLAEHLRENVQLEPASAAAWQRLGITLLYGLGQEAEAVGALEQAVRLAPSDAGARLDLALALQAAGRGPEAANAADEAVRLDPAVLEARPAARAALDAARRGEPWP
jgi:tetratricopeptide (TPR) repeat protein